MIKDENVVVHVERSKRSRRLSKREVPVGSLGHQPPQVAGQYRSRTVHPAGPGNTTPRLTWPRTLEELVGASTSLRTTSMVMYRAGRFQDQGNTRPKTLIKPRATVDVGQVHAKERRRVAHVLRRTETGPWADISLNTRPAARRRLNGATSNRGRNRPNHVAREAHPWSRAIRFQDGPTGKPKLKDIKRVSAGPWAWQ